jgi:hypothetical protein
MIVRARARDEGVVTLNLQPGSVTVAFNEQTVLAYDRMGRLWSAFCHGYTFRRGLDGGVLGKWTQFGQRHRQRLWRSEAALVVNRSAELMRSLSDAVFDASPDVLQELEALIERSGRFTAQHAHADAERFLQIYKPIGILPPDQYQALVLQLTEGCSFNTCTFCTFYRDRAFRIKSPDEFRAHIAAVRYYLGEALWLRRGIFLADANALVVPHRQLVTLLDVLRDEIAYPYPRPSSRIERGGHTPLPPWGEGHSLFAFLDGFSGRKKSADDYAELASFGLARVYLGLESGHDPLLQWLHKPGHAADAIESARAIKAGGVNVCVIVLLGAGGGKFAEGHVCDTIEVINAMQLGEGDLLYFSEFVAAPGQPYGQIAERDSVWPLSVEQMRAQRLAIEAGLAFPGLRPRFATYNIREFVY